MSKFAGFVKVIEHLKAEEKEGQELGISAVFATVSLKVMKLFSLVVMIRAPVTALCLVALALDCPALVECGAELAWLRVLLLVVCSLNTTMVLCRARLWLKIGRYERRESDKSAARADEERTQKAELADELQRASDLSGAGSN